jgi:hypothetical protein
MNHRASCFLPYGATGADGLHARRMTAAAPQAHLTQPTG